MPHAPSRSHFALATVRLSALAIVTSSGFCVSARAQDLPSPYTGLTAPITVCFAEGTPKDYAERKSSLVAVQNQWFTGPTDYFLASRWSGGQGTPRTLTWSFAPDGLSIGSGVGEPTSPNSFFATMDSGFSAQGGRATWILRIQQVFNRWQEISGVTFVRVTSGGNDWDDGAAWGTGGGAGRGDIRIAMHPIDGGGGILAYCSYPTNGGDMVLDANDISSYASSTNLHRFLRDVVAHEMGHGLGIQHVCTSNSNQLMEPFINTSFDGPQQDDIRAMHRHYGDPLETNDSAGAATSLGTLVPGGTLIKGALPAPITGSNDPNAALCSIDASGKVDWFSVSASTGINATITATPVGSTYDNNAQAANGSCPTGASTNALAAADLIVTVFGSNGTTVLGTSNATGAGSAEVASNISVPTGTFYVRVSANGSPTASQLYRLSVTGTASGPVCPSFTLQPSGGPACFGDAFMLTVTATGNPAPTYQWQKDSVNIPGATSSSYTSPPVTESDSGSYVCIATNGCGSTPSTPAVVTVIHVPTITQQPQSVTVSAGSPASFTVAGTDVAEYQWYLNHNPIGGATGPTYSIPAATPADAGSYECTILNNCGFDTSNAATLTLGTTAPCYANCDASTTAPSLNVGDFTCFLQKYSEGNPYANCDGSTTVPVLNVGDFTCFLQSYAAGCSAP